MGLFFHLAEVLAAAQSELCMGLEPQTTGVGCARINGNHP